MAKSVAIPINYGLATLRWTFLPSGALYTCTIGYKDTLAADTPNAAATTIASLMSASGRPCSAPLMTTQWRFEGVSVLQRLSNNLLQVGLVNAPVTGTATATANLSPVFTTAIVSKVTSYAGRAYRGRMYPPLTAVSENSVDFNGIIAPGDVTTFSAAWVAAQTAFLASNYPPYLLHAPNLALVTPLPTAINSLVFKSVVGIQRRRRARVA